MTQAFKQVLTRWVRVAVYVTTLVVVPILLVGLFAPSDSALVVTILRARNFPSAVRDRHRSCTVRDAWNLAFPGPQFAASQRIAAHTQTLQTDGDLIQVATPAGLFWIPSRDSVTLPAELAEQEFNIYALGEIGVRPGDIVLDCGANVGVYTRAALNRGAKLVVAIDPAPTAITSLRRNFQKEIEAGRVIVYPKGVWNAEANLHLTTGTTWATTANSVAINRGDPGPIVPLTTIDALVRDLKLTHVDFIKMDIEGSEMQALEGGRETIAKFRPRLAVSLEHRRTDPDDVPSSVHRLWPDAQAAYGPCTNTDSRVQPNVLFVSWGR